MSDQELIVEEGFTPDPTIIAEMEAEDKAVEAEVDEQPDMKDDSVPQPDVEVKDPSPFEFTVGGETKEYSAHEIKSALGRQRKLDETLRSEQFKLGTLMKAAQGGDATAQKKVQNMLVKMTGSDDADGMLEKLEDEKGEFDEDKVAEKQAVEAEFDSAFADVKDSVDYAENLAIMDGSLKARIPEALFNEFNSAPQAKRAMYNLVASGRMDHLLTAFEQKISALPHEKRQKIQTDPELYGQEFLLVVEQDNARIAKADKPSPKKAVEQDDGMGAVSTSPSNRIDLKPSEPDFENMSDKEFDAYRRKNGITV